MRTDEEGRTTITVPPLSAVVWRADRTARPPRRRAGHPPREAVGRRHRRRSRADHGRRARRRLQPGHRRLASRRGGGVDRRSAPTTTRPTGSSTTSASLAKGTLRRVPRGAARQRRQPVGRVVVRHRRRPGGRAHPRRWRGRRTGRPAGRRCRCPAATTPRSAARATGSPDCAQAQMSLDADDLVWKKQVVLPAPATTPTRQRSTARGTRTTAPAACAVAATSRSPSPPRADVTFYYEHGSHWITSDADGPIITLAGSRCSPSSAARATGSPACMRGWLEDLDGDGTYTWTGTLPAGSYETKVAHGLTWDENYGQDGVADGADIPFDVPAGGVDVVFSYDVSTHRLQISTRSAGAVTRPDQGQGAVAAPRPRRVGRPRRPSRAATACTGPPTGDLAVDAEDVTGGSSVPLTYDPAGLPADVLADFPQLEGYEAFRLDRPRPARVPEILTGQLAVASYDPERRAARRHRRADPGRPRRPVRRRRRAPTSASRWGGDVPTLALWAPTAQDVLGDRSPGAGVADDAAGPTARGRSPVRRVAGSAPTPIRGRGLRRPRPVQVETNVVTDPYSREPLANSTKSQVVVLDDADLAPDGLVVGAPGRRRRPARGPQPLRAARARLLDQRRDRAGGGARHLPGVHAVRLGRHDAPARARRGRASPRCTCCRRSTSPRSRRTAPQQAVPDDLGRCRAGLDRAAGRASPRSRAQDGFNWGYDPLHYTTPEGSYATDPEGTTRIRRVPRDGAGAQPRPSCGW